MAKTKQTTVVKALTEREQIEAEIAGCEHAVKYSTGRLVEDSKRVVSLMADLGREAGVNIERAATEEYVKEHKLSASELVSWATNSLIWVTPNLHIPQMHLHARRLDDARRELEEARERLAALDAKEKKECE